MAENKKKENDLFAPPSEDELAMFAAPTEEELLALQDDVQPEPVETPQVSPEVPAIPQPKSETPIADEITDISEATSAAAMAGVGTKLGQDVAQKGVEAYKQASSLAENLGKPYVDTELPVPSAEKNLKAFKGIGGEELKKFRRLRDKQKAEIGKAALKEGVTGTFMSAKKELKKVRNMIDTVGAGIGEEHKRAEKIFNDFLRQPEYYEQSDSTAMEKGGYAKRRPKISKEVLSKHYAEQIADQFEDAAKNLADDGEHLRQKRSLLRSANKLRIGEGVWFKDLERLADSYKQQAFDGHVIKKQDAYNKWRIIQKARVNLTEQVLKELGQETSQLREYNSRFSKLKSIETILEKYAEKQPTIPMQFLRKIWAGTMGKLIAGSPGAILTTGTEIIKDTENQRTVSRLTANLAELKDKMKITDPRFRKAYETASKGVKAAGSTTWKALPFLVAALTYKEARDEGLKKEEALLRAGLENAPPILLSMLNPIAGIISMGLVPSKAGPGYQAGEKKPEDIEYGMESEERKAHNKKMKEKRDKKLDTLRVISEIKEKGNETDRKVLPILESMMESDLENFGEDRTHKLKLDHPAYKRILEKYQKVRKKKE